MKDFQQRMAMIVDLLNTKNTQKCTIDFYSLPEIRIIP